MLRVYLLFAGGLLLSCGAPVAFAQPGPDSIGVQVTSADFTFDDIYQFQTAAPSQFGLQSGVLKTGGITSIATVSRKVSRMVPYTVTKTTYRIVNGRLVAEQVQVTQYRTVFETVLENIEIELPAANGTWYAINGPAYSFWLLNSVSSSGVVIGLGTRQAGQVQGIVTFASFPTSPIPTGTYRVETLPEME